MTPKRFKCCLAAWVMIMISLAACGPLMVNTVVPLSRESYVPQINPEDYKLMRGKRVLFHGITDQSRNTSNFAYYNPGRTVGYELYYTLPNEGMPQPLISFFWYALKKGFEQAGIIIEDTSPIYDVELLLVFRSLTDREIQFDAQVRRAEKPVYEKSYAVKSPEVATADSAVLEKRAYGMMDAMVKTILGDPDFQKTLMR